MEYPTEATVRKILGPFHETLAKAVSEAHETWVRIASEFQRPLMRTRAQNISNAFYDRALADFGSVDGVTVVEQYERILLGFADTFVLRFKRLGRKKRTQNYPTDASLATDAQDQIELGGLGHLPRVVLGYTLAGLPLSLDGIFVMFAVKNQPLWAYSINGASTESLVLPFPAGPDATPHEFRWKEGSEEAEAEMDEDSEFGDQDA